MANSRNPIKQGLDQDPKGLFVRRWCPELAPVPLAFLHDPWKWEGASVLEGRYPRPLVDVVAAIKQARDAVFAFHADPDKPPKTVPDKVAGCRQMALPL